MSSDTLMRMTHKAQHFASILLSQFYRWENEGSEKFNDLTKIIHLFRGADPGLD